MEPANEATDHNGIQIEQFARTKFEAKWDILKPFIKYLYIDQNFTVSGVAEKLRKEYKFDAGETQYKHRFKKWGFKKNILTVKKEEICRKRQNRAKAGKSSAITVYGKDVDESRLRRHLKESTRREVARIASANGIEELGMLSGSSFLLGNSIFLNWNIPHGNLRSSKRPTLIASPESASTPSDVVMTTPPTINTRSPDNIPSPLTRLNNLKVATERAQMFLQGRYTALVRSMREEDRFIMSQWLYQFWFYGFRTAKTWGHGPRYWDAEILAFENYEQRNPTPAASSPASLGVSNDSTSREHLSNDTSTSDTTSSTTPSPLCRWAIHYNTRIKYQEIPSRTQSPDVEQDPFDERTWTAWPDSSEEPQYQRRLLRGLATNEFSTISSDILPISVPQLVKVVEKSETELLYEAIGFSVMARNCKLIKKTIDELSAKIEITHQLDDLHLFHIATSYLDGSRKCCQVISQISYAAYDICGILLRVSTTNNLGHSVIDNLMIAILKAHTSIRPGDVDESLRDEIRFPGEEVDICGRWDADSAPYRTLMRRKDVQIPFTWKHKFCHTSVQAVCHTVEEIDKVTATKEDAFSNLDSGLFIKRCLSCGLKMRLGQIHTLVVTTINLAIFGKEDEDLFGMITVLLHLLSLSVDFARLAEISISALFPTDGDEYGCDHLELTGLQLAERIPTYVKQHFSEPSRIGWRVFCYVLKESTNAQSYEEEGEEEEITPLCHKCQIRNNNPRQNLALLSIATKAEYLTYRRLSVKDPWLSPYFNLAMIWESLRNETPLWDAIGYTKNNMLKPFCRGCGVILGNDECLSAKDVMASHFSNLEDWSRTTFIGDEESIGGA